MSGDRKLEELDRVGGHVAVDFVNTVDSWRGGEPGRDYLQSYDDLLRWNRMAGLIDSRETRALAAASKRAQVAALAGALRLRASLYRLLHALACGKSLPQASLHDLDDVVRETARWRRLSAKGRGAAFGWDFSAAPAQAILGPVAWAAAGLLEHGEPERLKECPPNDGCGWLFLDSSRNRSRTWCSMKTCGNNAKVKRFRARHD